MRASVSLGLLGLLVLTASGHAQVGRLEWRPMPPLPESRYEAPIEVVDGTLLVFGGFTEILRSSKRVFALEPGDSVWQERGAMPLSVTHVATTSDGPTVWFAGGFLGDHPGAATTAVWRYDSRTDRWAPGPPLPEPRAGGVLVRLGRTLHYVSGLEQDRDTDSSDHWALDLGGGGWSPRAALARARNHMAGVALDGRLYVFGGQYNHDSTEESPFDVAAVDSYDPLTDSWTERADMPGARSHVEYSTFVTEGWIVVAGGRRVRTDLSEVVAYDPDSDRWIQLPRLPNALRSPLARAVEDRIVVLGGGRFEVQAQTAAWSGSLELLLSERVVPRSSRTAEGDVGDEAVLAFESRPLIDGSSVHPTTLAFGPDNRLYVGQQDGLIRAYTIAREESGDYRAIATEELDQIQRIPNHDDDGSASELPGRLLTGLAVAGSAERPVLYVSSSDPRISQEEDSGVDTNSGTLSKLERVAGTWRRTEMVRGLPRGKRDHASNGLALDSENNRLYLAQGGHTNLGAPSRLFLNQPEYALSAAILVVDLKTLGDQTYDLPTLDDEDRPNRADGGDVGDPFGGNNGKNQALLSPSGPVQIHSPGWRNPYDVALTLKGELFTIDNGANAGWGGPPAAAGGACTNDSRPRGTTDRDNLHRVTEPGYYGGHPNPTRGNTDNTFNGSSGAPYPAPAQSPVPAASPVECEYRVPGREDGALATLAASTNGLTEYTASAFDGELAGDLLGASWNGKIYRFDLDPSGRRLLAEPQPLLSGFGAKPLDVTATGDDHLFPGTIWAAVYGAGSVLVFEPVEGRTCDLADPAADPDGDGFLSADELASDTDPCSSASRPSDFDGDGVADRTDPDDDGDGLSDATDPFALDYMNGLLTRPPVHFGFAEEDDFGGLLGLGFTGLMTNGHTDYRDAFDPEFMTAGGAGGLLTLDSVGPGDARGAANDQTGALQFGLAIDRATGPVVVRSRLECPCLGEKPAGREALGMFVGTGTQDDFVALLVQGGRRGTELRLAIETGGRLSSVSYEADLPEDGAVTLELEIDPARGTLLPALRIDDGERRILGEALVLETDSALYEAVTGDPAVAVGVLATSSGAAPFPATWDLLEVAFEENPESLVVSSLEPPGRVLRINAGGGGYVEPGGRIWWADRYFEGGAVYEVLPDIEIASTQHPTLFRSERFGNPEEGGSFSYRIPVWEPGAYLVRLHLAEIYFGAPGAPAAEPGQRVFAVAAERGKAGIGYIDLVSQGPPQRASTRAFEVNVTDGTLDLDFLARVNFPKLSALEIIGPLAPPE